MNNLQTLRDAMFETLQGLKNGTIDIEKAKVMGEIGQVLINTAKVEVDFARANGGGGSNFIESNGALTIESKPASIQKTPTPNGLKVVEGNVTRHIMK